MSRALELARESVGLASPNPMVGCVLVREGVVLGQGAHRYELFDHAEIAALKDAAARGHDAAGATAYVTLEPCSHHGRTGPCADALVRARVGRVVTATLDPNPRVSGGGVERLRAAGVEVRVGVCEAEARDLNGGFGAWIRTGRPMITLKAGLSADGMLAPPDAARVPGETFWLTGAESRAEVQRMRHGADAVLTGIGTVLADDPLLTDRSGRPRRGRLQRVVLDSGARMPPSSRLAGSAEDDVLLFCGAQAPAERTEALRAAGVEVVRIAGSGGLLDLSAVVEELGRRQILNVLLECGSQLNGAFLRARLVDKVALFYGGMTLGRDAMPFAGGAISAALLESALGRVRRGSCGSDRTVEGYLRDPWTGLPAGDEDGRAAGLVPEKQQLL